MTSLHPFTATTLEPSSLLASAGHTAALWTDGHVNPVAVLLALAGSILIGAMVHKIIGQVRGIAKALETFRHAQGMAHCGKG